VRNQVKTNIQLTEDQKEAVEKIKDELFRGSGVATLSGYAGTGKTTLLKTLVDDLQEDVNETAKKLGLDTDLKLRKDKKEKADNE